MARLADRAAAIFAGRPWEAVREADLIASRGVPTMLSEAEQRLYHWLGRDWVRGTGAVVDLGAFVGGSTARLAEGLARGGKNNPLHAYDRFRVGPATGLKHLGDLMAEVSAGDMLPLARRLLAPWSDRIALHPGNILDQDWNGGEIELLVVDAAKSVETADHIAATFFPSLVPMRSIVVQQDFLHWPQPWLPAQMHLLGGFLRPLALVGPSCVAFLCTRVIGSRAIRRARLAGLSDAQLLAQLRAARDALGAIGAADGTEHQIRALRRRPGGRSTADMKAPKAS